MDIFFPTTDLERAKFKETAIQCGFEETTAENASNIESLPAHDRLSVLLTAWTRIGDYLTQNQYNPQLGNIVSFVGRSTLTLWFGREWITCSAENKTSLIDQMMKVFPAAYLTMHPYSWPYMFSVYRDPWMVEYLNINFQRMSAPDLTPTLESIDSEFMQQEGIPLLILRMVNMFDFSMVKLVKFMCLRLLLTWQNETLTASRTLRDSHNADEYIDYARHIYLMAVCEINGFKDLHYTLETIQRNVYCENTELGPLEIGARTIAKGLQESNKTLSELLIAFLIKVPRVQLNNIFGGVLSKYTSFLTEYQLRKICCAGTPKLSWPFEEVFTKLIKMFIMHRESSEQLLKDTPKISEELFSKVYDLTASKCAYEIFKLRNRPEWYTTKVTLLLSIISEEINVVQDYKYNDIQSTDELIEKEKELAVYYRDLAKIFQKTPYLEQEAWLTTFSLHPCKEFLEAVTRCGSRNLRAIKKQAHKLKFIDFSDSKLVVKSENEGDGLNTSKEEKESVTTPDPHLPSTSSAFLAAIHMAKPLTSPDQSKVDVKPKPKRPPRKKPDKNLLKRVAPKTDENSATKEITDENMSVKEEKLPEAENMEAEEFSETEKPLETKKRGRPIGALGKTPKALKPVLEKPPKIKQKLEEKPDLAEEIFAAAAGAAEYIGSQTVETIKYPAFALMNSVTDTEDLMKFTNYGDAFDQYDELNRILMSIKLNHTKHEDILALIIAPRYKRLTWAISWKKLKKRCRVIITKVNRKRELVEQSMADANDRLMHLNIDYEKYKDKPQIDYGTIEGGYECFDTDSDDDKPNTQGVEPKKPTRIAGPGRGRRKKVVNTVQGALLTDKQILKIENLDTSQSNLLNSIEPTQLSKPVFLNKPVYIVRNPLSTPPSETAISFEAVPNNKSDSRTSSRRSTGETTLTSDSFEEHHWQVTTTPVINNLNRRKSLEQAISSIQFRPNMLTSRSPVKTEPTFNIPASIKQQLEHPTMFFKPRVEDNLNLQIAVVNDLQNTQTNLPENTINLELQPLPPLRYFSSKEIPSCQTPGAGNNVNTQLETLGICSPKLFEDMPEDLTMPKPSNMEQMSDKSNSLQIQPLNLTDKIPEDKPAVKKRAPRKRTPKVATDAPKKPRKRLPKQQQPAAPKIPKVTKRQPKAGGRSRAKKDPAVPKMESTSTVSPSGLSSVRVTPPSKQANGTRINPTAAVAISSAAASYHRTPFLNAEEQESPNILQQLLSGENNSSCNNLIFDVTPVTNAQCSESRVHFQPGASGPGQSATNSTFPGSQLEVSTGSSTNNSGVVESTQIPNLLTTPYSSTNDSLGNLMSPEVYSSINATLKPEESLSLLSTRLSEESITLKSVSESAIREENLVQDPALFATISSGKLPVIDVPSTQISTEQWVNELDGESIKALLGDETENGSHIEDVLFGVSELTGTSVDDSCANSINELNQLESKKADTLTEKNEKIFKPPTAVTDDEKKALDDFVFKVPAPVPKPCFFKQSKKTKVAITIPSWAHTIFKSSNNITAINSIKVQSPNESTPSTSKNPTDDILYDNQKVFNPKLLDPHLKTYINNKSSIKSPDAKKSNESMLENDAFLSDNSSATHAAGTEPLFKEPKTSSPPPIASTSKQFVHTERKLSESDKQQECETPIKKESRKRNKRVVPSKRLVKMEKRIETIIKASKQPLKDSEDPSSNLVNILGAQIMSQAKCIHFNQAYLKEVESLTLAMSSDENKAKCEASILIAYPEPSADAMELVKAFQKSNMFKGLNVGGGEVSLTSALAKEVLGTVVKVTLNESDLPQFDDKIFDPSDVLDDFTRWRRDANSPTFYSPTISVKHIKNGTVAKLPEYIDIPTTKIKRAIKRISKSDLATSRVNSKNCKEQKNESESEMNSSDDENEQSIGGNSSMDCSAEIDSFVESKEMKIEKEISLERPKAKRLSREDRTAIVRAALENSIKPSVGEKMVEFSQEVQRNEEQQLANEDTQSLGEIKCAVKHVAKIPSEVLNEKVEENIRLSIPENNNREAGEQKSVKDNSEICELQENSTLQNTDVVGGEKQIQSSNNRLHLRRNSSLKKYLTIKPLIQRRRRRKQSFAVTRVLPDEENVTMELTDIKPSQEDKYDQIETENIGRDPTQPQSLSKEENSMGDLTEPQSLSKEEKSSNELTEPQTLSKEVNSMGDITEPQSFFKEEHSMNDLAAQQASYEDTNTPHDLLVEPSISETTPDSLDKQSISEETQKASNNLIEEPNQSEKSGISLNEETFIECPIKISSPKHEDSDEDKPLQPQIQMPYLKTDLPFVQDETVLISKLPVEDSEVAELPTQETDFAECLTEQQTSNKIINMSLEEKATTVALSESPLLPEDVSDDDKPLQPRPKVPSLKINLPPLRRRRNRVTKRLANGRKAVLAQRRIRRKPSEKATNLKLKKELPHVLTKKLSPNVTDSDEDVPLKTQEKTTLLEKEALTAEKVANQPLKEIQIGTRFSRTRSSTHVDESDEDVPLIIQSKQTATPEVPSLLPPSTVIKGRTKVPAVGYTSRRPSVRIQSKHTPDNNLIPMYSALFLDESDDDKLLKPMRLRATPDRAWAPRNKVLKKRKTLPVKKIKPNQFPASRKKPDFPIRRNRGEYSQKKKSIEQPKRKKPFRRVLLLTHTQRKKRIPKPRIPVIKMPVLTREDSDHMDVDNIYECATMSTANETDEDAGSDYRPRRTQRKVVKPMRIRCVSRRAVPIDIIHESSSCSSPATVPKSRQFAAKSTSLPPFSNRRNRSTRRNALESGFVTSQLIDESSSSSNQISSQPRKRRFAAKSTSKPACVKNTGIVAATKTTNSFHELSSNDIAAIVKHNCIGLEVRLQRLTTSDAIMCRKPSIRLERNFVQNYLTSKTQEEQDAELDDENDGHIDE